MLFQLSKLSLDFPLRSIDVINYFNTFPSIVPGLVLMQHSFNVLLTSVCLYFSLDFPLDSHKSNHQQLKPPHQVLVSMLLSLYENNWEVFFLILCCTVLNSIRMGGVEVIPWENCWAWSFWGTGGQILKFSFKKDSITSILLYIYICIHMYICTHTSLHTYCILPCITCTFCPKFVREKRGMHIIRGEC